MSSTRPGNQCRGWNDPPEFLHDNSEPVNIPTTGRTILNKRVAHSLTPSMPINNSNVNNTGVAASPPKFSMPPVGNTNAINHASISSTPTSVVTHQSDHEIKLEIIEKTISEKLNYLRDNGVAAKIIDDLTKRIKLFSNSWEKLSEPVKVKMDELSSGK